MTDELDALRAALKAAPAPDPAARAAALRRATENFDRLQGSTDAARLGQDRPAQAGFLKKVSDMLKSLNAPAALAATTSVAAICVGLLIAWPQMQPNPSVPDGLPVLNTQPKPVTPPAVPAPSTAPGMAPNPQDLQIQSLPAAPMMAEAPPALNSAELQKGQVRGFLVDPAAKALALADGMTPRPDILPPDPAEAFANAPPNPVHVTAEEPVSTFSLDIDTASYSVIRANLNAGQLPPPDAVRIEEMVNYFPYDYAAPTGDAPFATSVAVMQTPWNPDTRLVRIALQGRPVTDRPALNLIFLIDTSGSMNEPGKLPLLKQSLALMLGKLTAQDRVAIVAYAGSAGQVLAPTRATDRSSILAALDNLAAGGSTAGAAGLTLAYQVAAQMQAQGSVTRVLLTTDGDFNVGIDTPDALQAFIARERDTGIYLSVLGFGRGNLDDATMQALAQNGNGTASYIDTLSEAQKVLSDQMTGAMFPIADDVKVQVEWNPAQVAEYRLIGYETRALRREDFNNDRVDAGEIGAGLQMTALYEVTAPGSPSLRNDPLRYAPAPMAGAAGGELGFLRLRYKAPGQTVSNLIQTPITGDAPPADDDTRFAAAIAGFGQLLRGSVYLGDWGYDQAIALATAARGPDPFGYRAEAVTLMRLAQSLTQH